MARRSSTIESTEPSVKHLAVPDSSGVITAEEVHVGVCALHISVYLLQGLVVLCSMAALVWLLSHVASSSRGHTAVANQLHNPDHCLAAARRTRTSMCTAQVTTGIVLALKNSCHRLPEEVLSGWSPWPLSAAQAAWARGSGAASCTQAHDGHWPKTFERLFDYGAITADRRSVWTWQSQLPCRSVADMSPRLLPCRCVPGCRSHWD
jgi:hypothetical protein